MRELDDTAAYMLLVTDNAQSELTALERGLHALKNPKHRRWVKDEYGVESTVVDVKAYVESVGRPRTTVQREIYAAEVAATVPIDGHKLDSFCTYMVEIHAARRWLWPALGKAMLENEWSVEDTRTEVAR